MQNAVVALYSKGQSCRQIARQLGVNRRTVSRYVALAGADFGSSKCTTPTPKVATGSVRDTLPKCSTPESKVATGSVPGSATGSRSRCEPWRDAIEAGVEVGLTAERIWQDLRLAHGFDGAYNSVKRFVATLRSEGSHAPRPVFRVECEPGEEVQIDFMLGPMLPDPQRPGKRRRCWILRAVLSHSRKGYSEAVWRQDSESFLRAVENALRAFGGVPVMLNLDNLRAAVKRADWFDPELSPKFADFCRHYGITAMPCRPYCPQHKGKVERSVQFVRGNALAGREFATLAELNAHLAWWEVHVADTRIHGTYKQQVAARFALEKPCLKPLPLELFPAYTECKRLVSRDGYVEVAKAYYQAPPEFIGRNVWVHFDGRAVRLFDEGMKRQIATHIRLEPGRHSRVRGARGLDHAGSVQSTLRYWQSRVQAIGPAAARWAQRAATERGAEAIRSLMGLYSLFQKHGTSTIEQACTQALENSGSHNPTLSAIHQNLPTRAAQATQHPTQAATTHPLIRELFVYGQFVQTQTQATSTTTNTPIQPTKA